MLVAVLLAAIVLGFASRGTTPPRGLDAPADAFSAERAADAVAPVVAEPRPIGSPANDEAHQLLSDRLDELGFEVATHEAIGTSSNPVFAVAGFTRSLVATRPGTDPTGTIVLATHIDSVPGAPGAADAGVGLAAILETVRALGPEAQRNDLMVLLVDGEENGLLGADAYIREQAGQLTGPVVVLNHEARGVSGRPLVTRTSGPMHEVLPSMPRPEFESFTDALFAIIPNDTDFTIYRQAGWWGMDMAIIDDSWAYHSPQDDAAHLDPASLQHYGDMTLALTRDLGGRDLQALAEEADEQPVVTTAPWGIVQLPPVLVTVLGVIAPIAVLVTVVIRRRRRELTVLGTVVGALGAAGALVLGLLAATTVWTAASQPRPEMLSRTVGEPVRSELFFAAEIAAAATAMIAVWVLLRWRAGRAGLCTGAALAVTTLLAVLAVLSPALGGWIVVPLALAAIGALLAVLLGGPIGLAVRALALLPAGWMLGTQTSALMEFGIASSSGAVAGTALLALAAVAPLFLGSAGGGGFGTRHGRHRRTTERGAAAGSSSAAGLPAAGRWRCLLIPAVPAVLTVVLAAAGVGHTMNSPEPVQERVNAHVDGATGETRWEATASTAWGAEMDERTATSRFAAPTVEVQRLTDQAPGRVQFVVRSPRAAPDVELQIAGGVLRDVIVDGTDVDSDIGLQTVRLLGVRPEQAVVIEATLDGEAQQLTVIDRSHDPSAAGGWVAPPEDVSLVEPALRVSTTVDL